MENWKFYTPDGVQDTLFTECEMKRNIEHNFRMHFRSAGYREVETPTLEYFDVFSSGTGRIEQEMMYKFSDKDGRLLVLRPDLTIPAVRLYSTKIKNKEQPVKMFYIGNTFRSKEQGGGRFKEFTQAGAEIIGNSGATVDAEIISRAISMAKLAGLEDFLIDIGHVEFFKAIIEEAGFSENEGEEIRALVDCKDFTRLESLLNEKNLSADLHNLILSLPSLFGDVDILDKAEKFTENIRAVKAIEYLREVLAILTQKGFRNYVSIDLGLVSSLNYYTGIIFKGFTYGIGFPIISGGRYDTLVETYGEKACASGFSIGINMLMQALSSQKSSDNNEKYLNVALSKGRLASLAMDLFGNAGIDISELKDESTRKLIITDEVSKVRFFLVKPSDVPTYVEYGAADIGVVGRDTILEEGKNLYEVLDLGFGKCRMCVAGPKELYGNLDLIPNKRVATKYPNIAREYYEHTKLESVEIIKLNGSVELAPLVGLSEVIVDIVESGRTLKENGLDVLETIADLSARMVVNRVSMKIERTRITKIIDSIREQLQEKKEK